MAASLEQDLHAWTGPSSPTEQDKQDRTERMVREAVAEHPELVDCDLRVFAKGSYANNTNVRVDSDVDIAVECTEVLYWDEQVEGAGNRGTPYRGVWSPEKLRSELIAALRSKFGGAVDTSGSTAIAVNSSSARVDADVVPCFSHTYYFENGNSVDGTKIFRTDDTSLSNYPDQQLSNGRAKNKRTDHAFKKTVRIMKRVALAMADEDYSMPLPSYFVECLVYNCPDSLFARRTWTETVEACLSHIYNALEGQGPADEGDRWLEVNDVYLLFHPEQDWTRGHGRGFAYDAWNYLGLGQ